MKIVYVGDNRNRGNLGCRATSTALSQLISEDHQIVGRITGKYNMWNMGDLFCIKGLPRFFYCFFSRLPGWNKLRKLWFKMIYKIKGRKMCMSGFDFADVHPTKSRKYFINCIEANQELKEFDLRQYDFDALVINGEGSFIFATPPWREALIITMLMDWAQSMGKKVFLLNAMFSDDPFSAHNEKTIRHLTPVLEKCDVVSMREYYSLAYCKKHFPGVDPVFYPDALFSWYDLINDGFTCPDGKYFMPHGTATDEAFHEFDFTAPYICVAGSSASKLRNNLKEAVDKYAHLATLAQDTLGLKTYLVETCEGDDFLKEVSQQTGIPMIPMQIPIVAMAKILANARVFISGRYHPSILASLGGTPCVLMGSNSHKTISLQELLQMPDPHEFDVLPDEAEAQLIVNAAAKRLALGEAERERIKARCHELNFQTRQQVSIVH